jgi:hypothetical protein
MIWGTSAQVRLLIGKPPVQRAAWGQHTNGRKGERTEGIPESCKRKSGEGIAALSFALAGGI